MNSFKDKFLIAQIAPSVRVAIGEEFGLPPGTITTGKIVTGLKKLGFDKVFDTQFSADLTIMEEAAELVERITHKGILPMFTSCCPAWVYFIENNYPQLTKNLSTCKSPQQMMGAIVKTYYAQKNNLKPDDIYLVSIMPCLVKKYEGRKINMESAYEYWKNQNQSSSPPYPDIDASISTVELADLFRENNINFNKLSEEEFDHPLGGSSGAGTIFGATGGVMEAALRTAYELITKKPLEKIDFENLRGMTGSKKAVVNIDGKEIKVAVVNGIFQAKLIIDEIIKNGPVYHFIEVMNCQGGCIGGSGQPPSLDKTIRMKRIQALYQNDLNKKIRKSHENPDIISLYRDFLGKPLSEKAHLLLHTSFK